uniref:Orexin receptor type 2-like n=1 Tax=Geotrypetes seraphini TaxID=260995 RepID=A0A6P8T0X4_GEOSA|nr:orexin receptor type 2-like [Geotrypetes seraphini]
MNPFIDQPSYNWTLLTLLKRENLSTQAMGNGSQKLNVEELEKMLFLFAQEPTTIILITMYVISFVVGFVGNIMSIKVLTKKRKSKMSSLSATRTPLINLAICDLLVVCVCMPIAVGNLIYKVWVYGDFLCRAVPFIQAVSVSASVLSLTVISVNRYYNVHNPLNARSFFTQRRIFCTIIVVWVLSSSICMPLIFMNKRDEIGKFEGLPLVFPVCREIWPQVRLKHAYNFLLFCALYCLPVLFNSIICFLTVRKLWWTTSNFKGCDSGSQSVAPSRLKTRKKIAKMVVALLSLFAASWLPVYLLDIWIDFNIPQSSQHVDLSLWVLHLRPFAQWLGLTNSSLNPICYCFVGDLYRSAKEIKSKYHQRMVSLLHFSFSEGSPTRQAPETLSCQTSNLTIRLRNLTIPLRNLSIPLQNLTIRLHNLTIPLQNLTIRLRNLTIPLRNISIPLQNLTIRLHNLTIPLQNLTIRLRNLTIPLQNLTIRLRNLTIPLRNLSIPLQNLTIRLHNLTIPLQNLTIRLRNLTIPLRNLSIPLQNLTIRLRNLTIPLQNLTIRLLVEMPNEKTEPLQKHQITESQLVKIIELYHLLPLVKSHQKQKMHDSNHAVSKRFNLQTAVGSLHPKTQCRTVSR